MQVGRVEACGPLGTMSFHTLGSWVCLPVSVVSVAVRLGRCGQAVNVWGLCFPGCWCAHVGDEVHRPTDTISCVHTGVAGVSTREDMCRQASLRPCLNHLMTAFLCLCVCHCAYRRFCDGLFSYVMLFARCFVAGPRVLKAGLESSI